MIATYLLVIAAVAMPAPQVSALEHRITQTAIDFLPTHLRGTIYPDTFGLEPSAYVISATTIGGEEEIARKHLEDWYSSVIASELLASYQEKANQPLELGPEFESKFQILNLETFRREPVGYDWPALQRAHPDVKVVIRISRPGIDSLGSFATVRYEVLTPRGRRWASFTEFSKTPAGAWEFDQAVVGNLWSRVRQGTKPSLQDANTP